MSLQSAFELALRTLDFPDKHPLHQYGDWRLNMRGPWNFSGGVRWWATAEPYNATGKGRNVNIEGEGANLEEALLDLVTKIHQSSMPKLEKVT